MSKKSFSRAIRKLGSSLEIYPVSRQAHGSDGVITCVVISHSECETNVVNMGGIDAIAKLVGAEPLMEWRATEIGPLGSGPSLVRSYRGPETETEREIYQRLK